MNKKKVGLGSLSLILVIIALVWSYNISDFCLGDKVLAFCNLPTWSNNSVVSISNTFSIVPFSKNDHYIHYTIFYSLILLFPALIIAIEYKNDLFASIGKWLALIFITLLVISPLIVFL